MKKLILIALLGVAIDGQLSGSTNESFKPGPLIPASTKLQPFDPHYTISAPISRIDTRNRPYTESRVEVEPTAEQLQKFRESQLGTYRDAY